MTQRSNDPIDRLHELTLIYLEGLAEADEVAELQTLIAESSAHRELFVEIATRARMLADASGATSEALIAEPIEPAAPVGRIEPVQTSRRPTMIAVAAALLMVGAVVGVYLALSPGAGPETRSPYGASVGVVLASRDATIERPGGDTDVINDGDSVRTGPFVLASGSIEIETASGAQMRLEAPVSLTVLGADRVHLHGGTVSARVPEQAIGFTVDTREFGVIDLGTEFAVTVAEGGVGRVFVYEGLVEVRWRSGKTRRISAGGHHAVGPDGELAAIDVVDAPGSAFEWPLGRVDAVPVAAGLTGYYRFDGFDDRRVAHNLAPRGMLPDGVIVGGSWDRVGDVPAMRITGPSDSVAFTFSEGWPACTIAMRVWIDSLRHQELTGLMMSEPGSGGLHYQIESDGELVFHHYGDTRYSFPNVIRDEDLGRWLHLTVTYDAEAGEIAVYRDGELIRRQTATKPAAVNPGRCRLARWSDDSPRSLDGAIAELAIYNRALDEQEVHRIGSTRLQR